MRYVTIWCDGKVPPAMVDCGKYLEGDTAAEVRRRARGSWLVNLPGGRDLCPDHRDQSDAATRWGDGT